MKVETYEVSEVTCENEHEETEAREIAEQLGLEGQKRVRNRDGVMPYREITAEEAVVFKAICDKEVRLHEFDRSPIPLRVLQVAAHGKDFFDEMVVWCPSSLADKDPILLGKKKHPTNSWVFNYFLLARWGDELDEWPALCRKAADKLREVARGKLLKARDEAAAALARLDEIKSPTAIPSNVYLNL
jgi:hypothetical protein